MFVELLALFVVVTVISFAAWLLEIERRTRQLTEWQKSERPFLRRLRRLLQIAERVEPPRPAVDPAEGLEPGDVHPFAPDAFVTAPGAQRP